jgi:hypothetical protein
LTIIELMLLLSNGIIFKSSTISAEQKLQYGAGLIAMVVILLFITMVRTLLHAYHERQEKKKERVTPTQGNMIPMQTTTVTTTLGSLETPASPTLGTATGFAAESTTADEVVKPKGEFADGEQNRSWVRVNSDA